MIAGSLSLATKSLVVFQSLLFGVVKIRSCVDEVAALLWAGVAEFLYELEITGLFYVGIFRSLPSSGVSA